MKERMACSVHRHEGAIPRRELLRRAAAFGIGIGASGWLGRFPAFAATAQQLAGPVNFLGWPGHKEDDEVKDFFSETNVKVNFVGFSENADALAKVKLEGGRRYDIVAVDALWAPKYYELGLIEPLDLKSWPLYEDLFDEFKALPAWTVDGKSLALPWGWSPVGIWYNPKYVTGNPSSWDVVFDSRYRRRVSVQNQPVDIIAFMGVATGAKRPYEMTNAEISRAKDALKRFKPNILKLVEDQTDMVKGLVDESIWLAIGNIGIGWRVKNAGGGEVKLLLPKEGYIGYYDGDSLVKGAAHREAAIAWLQHRSQAKYVAMNFLRIRRPLAFKNGYDLLVREGKGDEAKALMYDKPEVAQKMIVKGPPPNLGDYIDAYNEVMA